MGLNLLRNMVNSPGFISREWIESMVRESSVRRCAILPALLVGSGLKQLTHNPLVHSSSHSPGFIGREWPSTECCRWKMRKPCRVYSSMELVTLRHSAVDYYHWLEPDFLEVMHHEYQIHHRPRRNH